jgi:hypothetical protein
VFGRGCPAGFLPRARFGGTAVSATEIEQAGSPICGGLGYFVDAEAVEDVEWVGTDITQNAACTVGCFIPSCQRGQDVCFGRSEGVLCSFCSRDVEEGDCRDFVLGCHGLEPDDVETGEGGCGIESGGGGGDGD